MPTSNLTKIITATATRPLHINSDALVCHLNSTHQNDHLESLLTSACQQQSSYVFDVNPDISYFHPYFLSHITPRRDRNRTDQQQWLPQNEHALPTVENVGTGEILVRHHTEYSWVIGSFYLT